MDGNMFWNIVAISLRCMPSPLKWFIISNGWYSNWDWVAWFRFSMETTSRLSEYESTLNVIVGPRGRRISRMYVDTSDLENVTRWVTFRGPATVIKSFSTFFLWTCIWLAYKNNYRNNNRINSPVGYVKKMAPVRILCRNWFFCMNGFFRVLVLEKTWVENFHSSFVVSMGRKNLDSCRKPCTCKISPLMQKYSNRNIIKQWKHIFIIYLNIATLF